MAFSNLVVIVMQAPEVFFSFLTVNNVQFKSRKDFFSKIVNQG